LQQTIQRNPVNYAPSERLQNLINMIHTVQCCFMVELQGVNTVFPSMSENLN